MFALTVLGLLAYGGLAFADSIKTDNAKKRAKDLAIKCGDDIYCGSKYGDFYMVSTDEPVKIEELANGRTYIISRRTGKILKERSCNRLIRKQNINGINYGYMWFPESRSKYLIDLDKRKRISVEFENGKEVVRYYKNLTPPVWHQTYEKDPFEDEIADIESKYISKISSLEFTSSFNAEYKQREVDKPFNIYTWEIIDE